MLCNLSNQSIIDQNKNAKQTTHKTNKTSKQTKDRKKQTMQNKNKIKFKNVYNSVCNCTKHDNNR